jgi:ABC-type sugar transport system permease subunit
MLVPMMIVPAVAGYVFWLFFQSNGPLNAIISMIIQQPFTVTWLSSEFTALAAVIIAEVWEWTPLMFLILLSGLVGLPEDQMRAATMLGASFWQKFRYLMLPMMKPIIVIALVIRGMEAVKIFDMIYLMTGGRSGAGHRKHLDLHVQVGLPAGALVVRGGHGHGCARDHDHHRVVCAASRCRRHRGHRWTGRELPDGVMHNVEA